MTEHIDPSQLRPGPIRHASLPPELLDTIQAVYEVVGPYLDTTLEQFEIDFMRDMYPDHEVAVWCSIAGAVLAYREKHPNSDVPVPKLLGALIAISTGVQDVENLGVPAEVGRRLLECYEGLGED